MPNATTSAGSPWSVAIRTTVHRWFRYDPQARADRRRPCGAPRQSRATARPAAGPERAHKRPGAAQGYFSHHPTRPGALRAADGAGAREYVPIPARCPVTGGRTCYRAGCHHRAAGDATPTRWPQWKPSRRPARHGGGVAGEPPRRAVRTLALFAGARVDQRRPKSCTLVIVCGMMPFLRSPNGVDLGFRR